MVAAWVASTPALRMGAMRMLVMSRTREVTPAAMARSVRGSPVR